MVPILIIQIILIVAGLVACVTDLKTGYIYNWLTYPLIAIGLAVSVLNGVWVIALIYAAAVLAIGYALYYTGKLGGGDIKLFVGITLMLPTWNGFPFILEVIVVASIAALVVVGGYYSWKYWQKGFEWKENARNLRKAGLLAIFLIAYLGIIGYYGILPAANIAVLAVIFAFGLIFLGLEKGIRNKVFLKFVSAKQLEEDDIIASDALSDKILKKLGLFGKRVVEEKELQKIRKSGLKKIPVYRNLPKFGPFIFIGILIALMLPEFLALIFMMP